MKTLKMIIGIVIFSLVVCVISTGSALALPEVWVSTTGNDTTGNGSQTSPFLTIEHAVDVVENNGIVHIAGGNYILGTSSQPYIEISKSITFEGSGEEGLNITTFTPHPNLTSGGSIRISGLRPQVEFKRIYFENFGSVFNGTLDGRLTIRNCKIVRDAYGDFISVVTGSFLLLEIRNSIIKNYGLPIWVTLDYKRVGASDIAQFTIINNTFVVPHNPSSFIDLCFVCNNASGEEAILDFKNNIFYGFEGMVGGGTGDTVYPSQSYFHYNNAYTTHPFGVVLPPPEWFLDRTNNIIGNPLFVTPDPTAPNANLRLSDFSPCKDTGHPDIHDLNGSRSDMGAYGGGGTAPTTPAAPSNLTARIITNYSIGLNWTDKSSNENGFNVYRKVGSAGSWVKLTTTPLPANTTSYTSYQLTPGTTYYYKVTAYNTSGESAPTPSSNGLMAVVPLIPVAPSNLSAIGYLGYLPPYPYYTQVIFQWRDNSNETYFYIEEDERIIARVPANYRVYTHYSFASQGTYHRYRIRAYNSNGWSGYSNTASVYFRGW